MKTGKPWAWLFWLALLGGYGLHAQAASRLQQPLPFSFSEVPLPDALARIEAETDIRFSFRSGLLPAHRLVSLRYEQTLASALDAWLAGTEIRYQEIGGTITLYRPARSEADDSPPRQVLSGYVVDEATGERLPYAKVWDLHSGQGTLANAFGFFSLNLPGARDSAQLMGRFLEYLSPPQALPLNTDQPLELRLKPYVEMDEVVIEERRDSNGPEEAQMSTLVLPVGEVNNLPALLGEPDVVRAVQLLPGVQVGNENGTDLFVRGGDRDQNLVLLDGVPLYYVDNRRSPVSIFNPDILQDVRLIKGGFAARYGGRLSSVMEVNMREGNRKEARFGASIGLLTVKATAEGPIGPKNEAGEANTSYLFSARRSHFDLFGRGLALLGVERLETGTDYSFYDFNAKLTHSFSERDRLYLSGYLGQDRDISSFQPSTRWRLPRTLVIGDTTPSPDAIRIDQQWNFRNVWGNAMGSLRWNHLWSERAFSNLSLSYSRNYFSDQNDLDFQFTPPGEPSIAVSEQRRIDSDVQDVILRWEMDWFPRPAHQVKWGVQGIWHGFQPLRQTRQLQFDQEIILDTEVGDGLSSGYEGSAFVEHDWRVTERFRLHTGLHAAAYRFRQQTYTSLQPRVSARYLLRPQLALKASYAEMQQFVHLLPGSGWIPATDRVPPAYSRQVAAGLAWTSPQGIWAASLEGYYKRMTDLVDYQEGWYLDVAPGANRWESLIETGGTGEAYGAELLLEKKQGRLRGWLGYTLAWNWRQFDNINGGARFPARFDRRHDLNLVALYTIKPGIELSGSWGLGIGDPFTTATGWHSSWVQDQGAPAPPDPSLTVPQSGIFLYEGGRNNIRMRAFHRLDLGISLTKEKPWGSRTWRFGVFNLYARQNPIAYTFQPVRSNESASTPGLFQTSRFPILPSISYGIQF